MLQKLRGKRGTKGFTLIELMIVVAIIGILAAIAIPNFLNYQKKSKTTEAKTNIGGIKTSEISYQAENDNYVACGAMGGNMGAAKVVWPAPGAAGGFDTIGWGPAGPVYYQYQVDTAVNAVTGSPQMVISAVADIDGDLVNGQWAYASEIATLAATTAIAGGATCSSDGQVQDLAPGTF